jgi:hypothetical protein
MILERGVSTENLMLVRRPKPCTAILKIGDKVRLNSGGAAVPVVMINGDDITVEARDWRGRPEAFTTPRGCWQKATVWNWFAWKFHQFVRLRPFGRGQQPWL